MSFDWVSVGKDLATIVGVVIALLTLAKGVMEYTIKNTLDRFGKFQEIRKRMKESKEFQTILKLAETNDMKLTEIEFVQKRDLLGLFEEVTLMLYSKIIKKEVAHYMFGYYAVRLYEANYFWNDVNKGSYYWSVFCNFAEDMKAIENKLSVSRVQRSIRPKF